MNNIFVYGGTFLRSSPSEFGVRDSTTALIILPSSSLRSIVFRFRFVNQTFRGNERCAKSSEVEVSLKGSSVYG